MIWIRISDPRSVWIMVHQRNRRIHTGHGFTGSFDAPWSRQILDHWSWSRSPQRKAPQDCKINYLITKSEVSTYYLLTVSEVITGKSQTKACANLSLNSWNLLMDAVFILQPAILGELKILVEKSGKGYNLEPVIHSQLRCLIMQCSKSMCAKVRTFW